MAIDDNLTIKRLLNKPKLTFRWLFNRATHFLRATPSFVIAGTQKGGTSSLYAYLCAHPRVFKAYRKEVKYFEAHHLLGQGWYRANFVLQSKLDAVQGITGESSPNYMLFPSVAQRIHSQYPQMKVIFLLRNPIERAFSHHQHMLRRGYEHLPFEEAIAKETERLQGELTRIEADWRYSALDFLNYSYLLRGHYLEQLQPYLQLFPAHQILILNSEKFFSQPESVYRDTLAFLGMPFHALDEYTVVNQGGYNTKIDAGLRRDLQTYFEPHNQALYRQLGQDFGWQ